MQQASVATTASGRFTAERLAETVEWKSLYKKMPSFVGDFNI